jgi:hypothetical protein
MKVNMNKRSINFSSENCWDMKIDFIVYQSDESWIHELQTLLYEFLKMVNMILTVYKQFVN